MNIVMVAASSAAGTERPKPSTAIAIASTWTAIDTATALPSVTRDTCGRGPAWPTEMLYCNATVSRLYRGGVMASKSGAEAPAPFQECDWASRVGAPQVSRRRIFLMSHGQKF
jgi:hypothetical protein